MALTVGNTNPDWQAAEEDMRKIRAATRNCDIEFLFRNVYTVNRERGRLAKWVKITKSIFNM